MGVGAVILAGGKSKRFGSDKASALLKGQTFLDWSIESVADLSKKIVIVKATDQKLVYKKQELLIRDDLYPERGPLAGIVTGFDSLDTELAVVIACDMPLIRPNLLAYIVDSMKDYDVVVPRVNGLLQPLVAVYRREICKNKFLCDVENGENKIINSFDGLNVHEVDEDEIKLIDPLLMSFYNANTPSDFQEIKNFVKREHE